MTQIGLYSIDTTRFPNYALMKLARYHRNLGHEVEWYYPVWHQTYDRVYCSSVFTYSNKEYVRDEMVCGGSGFNLVQNLPAAIDYLEPDYLLYPELKHALGFLTRGCIRKCEGCVVPEKEGSIRPYRDIETVAQGRKSAVLMDNNVLACRHGLEQIERIVELGIRVDFNQGLDARLINPEVAELLGRVKWLRFIRMACDTMDMVDPVIQAAELIRLHRPKQEISVYLLVRETETAMKRAVAMRDHNLDVFAQPFRDRDGNEPDRDLKQFARWVNRPGVFKTVPWDDYRWKQETA